MEKVCTKCKKSKSLTLFPANKHCEGGKDSWCKPCKNESSKAYYNKNRDAQKKRMREYGRKCWPGLVQKRLKNPEKYLCKIARSRAKKEGITFSITPDDIHIPEFCPVLGIKLEFSVGKHSTDCSPTLDKLIPELGYVPGNISVISKRANRLKGDACLGEIESLLTWMTKQIYQKDNK